MVVGVRFPFDVYVVTGAERVALAALRGGAGAVQVRARHLDDSALLPMIRRIVDACGRAGAVCMVNDRVDLALAAGAHGAHLGQRDLVPRARERLGDGRLLGVSLDDPADLPAAEAAGASYVAMTVFPTATKPEAVPHGLDGLRAVAARAAVPVVAIGGITAANAAEVLAAGAAGVAVISEVEAAPDPERATRELAAVVRGVRR
ncbi:MAG TPA: thiamine phosphate synthase [Frankiaceae bacterium]|nr:thiamine phosphate synthase [Frankiaceae bacterium]